MVKRRTSRDILKTWLLLSFPLGLLAAIVLPGLLQGGYRPSMERKPSTSLKTIANAQSEFRTKDSDGDGRKEYWRADIAGLYAITPGKDPQAPAIKLIELSVACADDRPVADLSAYAVRSMKTGYWFRALLHADETTPNPQRFAACAFPENPKDNPWSYIVDENRVLYRKKLGQQRGIERYPKNPLQAGWDEVD